jgi:uncharacterized ParB-like nuclease family protein
MNKLDKVISIIRTLKEEAPTMNLGAGQIAGTVEAGDDPPVDLRTKKTKGWNIFFKNLVRRKRKKNKKNK